jgi:hypothetical protein
LISNAYGSAPVTIGAGHIALRENGGSIQGASGDTLTFSGRATMTIPAGATVYSDPVNLAVPAMADLAIDLYLPGDTSGATMFTMHNGAFQTNYISETGNYVGKTTLPNAVKIQNWFLLFLRPPPSKRCRVQGDGQRDRPLLIQAIRTTNPRGCNTGRRSLLAPRPKLRPPATAACFWGALVAGARGRTIDGRHALARARNRSKFRRGGHEARRDPQRSFDRFAVSPTAK